jgi:hypothetical protein
VVRNDHWLFFTVYGVAVFLSKYVDLALVEPQLTDISLQEEDIGALHAWIHHLRRWHLVTLSSAHYLPALFDAVDVEFA